MNSQQATYYEQVMDTFESDVRKAFKARRWHMIEDALTDLRSSLEDDEFDYSTDDLRDDMRRRDGGFEGVL